MQLFSKKFTGCDRMCQSRMLTEEKGSHLD